LTTPFNVTGGPALAQCIGFSAGGMPLSMQVVGRPFDDATVLRVAHAYEKATPWRARRPQLDPDAEFSTALPPLPDPEPAQLDAATRDRVAIGCRAAGLTLSDRQFEMACAAAPYVIAMTGRLYRDRKYTEEPANIFQFGG
jgi:aspartyl-tRNA(Asn)/glutamyl-tRNA(Gln) amidotransferase subunit A